VYNFIAILVIWSTEIQENEEFHSWTQKHLTTAGAVTVIAVFSLDNALLCRSKLFGLDHILNARMSRKGEVRLKYYGFPSLIIGDFMLMIAQVYMRVFVHHFQTSATVSLVFTGLSVVYNFSTRIYAQRIAAAPHRLSERKTIADEDEHNHHLGPENFKNKISGSPKHVQLTTKAGLHTPEK